jgi:predicted dehydrogenase/acetyltransferase-like isoleucine patch superfamily enzyme
MAKSPRIGMLGCGYWGRNLVRNFAELGALAALADSNPATAAALAREHGVPAKSFEELCADPGIDGIAIASPAALHFTHAKAALEAGKHVFVEKPLALEVAEAEELTALAASRGLTLMVGHLLQYHPAFLKLKEMVRSGALGRLQHVYSNRLNMGKIRREENVLWSFAPHDISMILSLMGEEPEEILATGTAFLHKRIADVTMTHLRFPSGAAADIFVSWLHPFKEQKLVVTGSEAMAVFDDRLPWDKKLLFYPQKVEWQDGMPSPVKGDPSPVPLEETEPLRDECRHFLDCVATGARPRTDGAEGVRVLRVLQASERSMLDSRPVRVTQTPAKAPGFPGVFVHESAYVDMPAKIGAGTKIWHFSHVLPGTEIGRDCNIGQNVVIGPDVSVGDRCKIQNNVSLYKGVRLAEEVFCGPSCVFTNVMNPRAGVERKNEFRPTPVGRGCTIGANATIVCGHSLGAYSFIAAGAVVTRDVPAHGLMAGVPARRIGWMSHSGERLGADLVCPASGRRYRESDAGLEEIPEARAVGA